MGRSEERKIKVKQLNKEKNNLKRGIERRMEKLTEEVNEINKKYQSKIMELKSKLMVKNKKWPDKNAIGNKVLRYDISELQEIGGGAEMQLQKLQKLQNGIGVFHYIG